MIGASNYKTLRLHALFIRTNCNLYVRVTNTYDTLDAVRCNIFSARFCRIYRWMKPCNQDPIFHGTRRYAGIKFS